MTLVSEDGDVSDRYIGILSNGTKEVLAFNMSNESTLMRRGREQELPFIFGFVYKLTNLSQTTF